MGVLHEQGCYTDGWGCYTEGGVVGGTDEVLVRNAVEVHAALQQGLELPQVVTVVRADQQVAAHLHQQLRVRAL
eukprot:2939898-Pyramimonas_sp.AAC.1